jgi:hypothetical protein
VKMLNLSIVAGLFLIVIPACGGSGSEKSDAGDSGTQLCDLETHPCAAGERCDSNQTCVPAEALVITTTSLPDGRVGFGYSQQIEAQGGLVPYSWSMHDADPALDFLTLSSRGLLEGSATSPVEDAKLTISVTDDGYGGGETVDRVFSISFAACREGDRELCYIAQAGECHQGFRTCKDGQMGDCEASADLSSDRHNCGPDCGECDGAVADGCTDGLCSCQGDAVCDQGEKCCSAGCTDVSNDLANCGSCQNDCTQRIAHVSGAVLLCDQGACDYSGECDRGWLDCDAKRDNGCEKQVVIGTCGACDTDCNAEVAHVPSTERICRDTGDQFVCDYTGDCMNNYGDCDGARGNGCEQYLLDETNCGACGVECAQAAVGSLCITPDGANPYFHICGCRFNGTSGLSEGCLTGDICCQHECRDAAVDSEHCGVCEAACTSGACVGGACGCVTDDDCPSSASATSCGSANACVCDTAGAGDSACPSGQYCCDGASGGSGGPNADQDLGCCIKLCGWNNEDQPCVQ